MRYYYIPAIVIPVSIILTGCQAIKSELNYQPKDEAERIAIRKMMDESRERNINRAYDWMQEERLR